MTYVKRGSHYFKFVILFIEAIHCFYVYKGEGLNEKQANGNPISPYG
jgi:hypothetical protein